MKEYSRRLIVIAKNGAKQQMHEVTVKVKQICEDLKGRINSPLSQLEFMSYIKLRLH